MGYAIQTSSITRYVSLTTVHQHFIALGVPRLKVKQISKNNIQRMRAVKKRNFTSHLHSFIIAYLYIQVKLLGAVLYAPRKLHGDTKHIPYIKHTNVTSPSPRPLRFPISEFLQFHTATKNTGVSMPRVDRPWKKGCHIRRRSHGKREDPISGPLISNKPTVSWPARQI